MDRINYLYAIIRDDGKHFKFDAERVYLALENSPFESAPVSSTDLEYSDIDGGIMIAQRRICYKQVYNGIIKPGTVDLWTTIDEIRKFFKHNHTYTLITQRATGKLCARRNAWLSDGAAVQIAPVANESYANFVLEFTVGDTNIYEYAEDTSGNEIYNNEAKIPLVTASTGGEVWDNVGKTFDAVGAIWEAGFGGIQTITADTSAHIYPIWTVKGPCRNPTLNNLTTDTTVKYTGFISNGQTLVVNLALNEAKLNGAVVSRNLLGQLYLDDGANQMSFTSDGGKTKESTIEWNNILA